MLTLLRLAVQNYQTTSKMQHSQRYQKFFSQNRPATLKDCKFCDFHIFLQKLQIFTSFQPKIANFPTNKNPKLSPIFDQLFLKVKITEITQFLVKNCRENRHSFQRFLNDEISRKITYWLSKILQPSKIEELAINRGKQHRIFSMEEIGTSWA